MERGCYYIQEYLSSLDIIKQCAFVHVGPENTTMGC